PQGRAPRSREVERSLLVVCTRLDGATPGHQQLDHRVLTHSGSQVKWSYAAKRPSFDISTVIEEYLGRTDLAVHSSLVQRSLVLEVAHVNIGCARQELLRDGGVAY